MPKNERIAVFIDGSNLYHKLKELNIPNTINLVTLDYVKNSPEAGKLFPAAIMSGPSELKTMIEKAKAFGLIS